jgi:hypothetical protein
MTDIEPIDILELAESVAAGRLTMNDAESHVRSRYGTSRRADAELAELRSLVAALGAIEGHARAMGEAASREPTRSAVPFGDVRSIAVDGAVRRRTLARIEARGVQRPVLAFAAVLLLGAGLAAASFVGGRLANRTPETTPIPPVAEASPTTNTSPVVPSVAPSATAPTATPPSATRKVEAVLWKLTKPRVIKIGSTAPQKTRPRVELEIDTWPDPDQAHGVVIQRQVLASPTGRFVAVAETSPEARSRIRIASPKGSIVWSYESSNGVPHLAWSADGSRLAIGFTPEPWLVVKPAPAGTDGVKTYVPGGIPLKLIGFCADSRHLLGYDGSGEAAPWEHPYRLDLETGVVESLDRFGAGPDRVASSNTTTASPLIDPVTGGVLDPGDLSGKQDRWSVRSGGDVVTLGLPVSNGSALIDPRWLDDGRVLVLRSSLEATRPTMEGPDPVVLQVVTPEANAKPRPLYPASWAYTGGILVEGKLLEARDGYAFVGLRKRPAPGEPWRGYDEVNLINLETGGMHVLSFEGPGAYDIHSAGLIH